MERRVLHIAAYDISDASRLRDALRIAKAYASGGQKSVFECYLTETERERLIREINAVIDSEEDRFLVLRLDPRSEVVVLGIAVAPEEPELFYVG